MVENQNVSFIYDMPDNVPTGMLKIKFEIQPVIPLPGDPQFGLYFRYNIEEM